jgi:hypothetical protein
MFQALPVAGLTVVLAAACVEPPVVSMGSPVQIGEVSANVLDVTASYLLLEGPRGAVTTEAPVLQVRLAVTNGTAEALRYDMGWTTTQATQAQTALLFRDPGEQIALSPATNVPIVQLGSNTFLDDPVTSMTMIPAGSTLEDILLFQLPDAGTSSLLLSLPPQLFGAENKLPGYIRIPWTAPAEYSVEPPVPLGEAFVGDGYTFTITAAEQSYQALTRAGKDGFSSSPLLRLNFEITNTGTTTIEYIPLRANRGIDAPTLLDEHGSPVEAAAFEDGITVPNFIHERRQIGAGETFRSFLLFRRPTSTSGALTFVMPGKRVGSTGLIRISVPYQQREIPIPEALRPPEEAPPAPTEPTE